MRASKPKLRFDQYLSILLVVLVGLSYKSFHPEHVSSSPEEPKSTISLLPVAPVPIRVATQIPEPPLTASSAAVIDVQSSSMLLARNERAVFPPASTTKLMTALVVREQYDLDDEVVVPDLSQIDGAKAGLEAGETYVVRNLLKAMLIPSANDAAWTLAFHYPGGVEAFVARMNTKAQELHLEKTIFENPTGYDGTHHQTSARDLALLSKEAMKDEVLKEIVKNKSEYITDNTRSHQLFLKSTHELIGVDPSVTGIKTGTTDGAGQVLITQVEKEGHAIIIVVMGSQDRYTDTTTIMNWVDTTHRWLDADSFSQDNESVSM